LLKSPWIIGLLAVICAFEIFILSPIKLKGVRKIGVVLLLSGLVLLAVKFTSDSLTSRIDHFISSSSGLGLLQATVVSFVNQVESSTVKVDFWFGIFYLALALIIFGLLVALNKRVKKVTSAKSALKPIINEGQGVTQLNSISSSISPKKPQPAIDSFSPEVTASSTEKITTAPVLKQRPNSKRRLIQ
jgi:hypothetical protein